MSLHEKSPIKAFIDSKAFRHNIDIVRKSFPKSMIILPVKANAYGHDDLIISQEAKNLDINYLAIARIGEGLKLRKNNIHIPIINFGIEFGNNINLAIENDIELSVSSIENLKEIEAFAIKKNTKIPIHLKVDTGMRRLGCSFKESEYLAKYIKSSPNLIFKSLYTHFAKSDETATYTQEQINLFINIKKKLSKKNISPKFYHLSNSGAILDQSLFFNNENFAIRPGIMAYGYTPYKDRNSNYSLSPIMTLVTKVIHLKKVPKGTGISYNHTYITKKASILATIALGYGDGFPRSLSNKFHVTINNKNYPQKGTISMDLTVIEVDKSVKIGDNVIIFGNKNKCVNDAKSLSQTINSISYEITTSLTSRVERILR